MKNKLPNFLIVGAAKSGTSSLHYYLNQHPDIFMPSFNKEGVNVKEPQFFVKNELMERIHFGIWNWSEYQDLFNDVRNEKAIGEASVFYLYYFKEAIRNINRYLKKEVKIIIILRNPIERAFSAYRHVSRSVKENLSFEEAISIESKRLEKDKTLTPMVKYKEMGLYYEMVKNYIDNFDHVHVLLYDDFANNTGLELKKIYRFLDIDSSVKVDYSKKHNVGEVQWNNKLLKSLALKNSRLKSLINKYIHKSIIENLWKIIIFFGKSNKIKMRRSVRNQLKDFYKRDVIKLSQLIEKDLSSWTQ